jgi:hypothetical protein
MIEWAYAERDGLCGGCGRDIAHGEPVCITAVIGVTRKFVRCVDCAGAAPESLPSTNWRAVAVASASPRSATFVPLQSASPPRTRGGLRRAAEWMPYRDE